MLTFFALILAFTVIPSPWGAALVLGAIVMDVVETRLLLRWSHRRRSLVGVAGLIGRRAVAVSRIAPTGQVRVDGELWSAVSTAEIEPGEPVYIREVEGLLLTVARADPC
jgi:membrane protein implicated in regulation of membrane protease activity